MKKLLIIIFVYINILFSNYTGIITTNTGKEIRYQTAAAKLETIECLSDQKRQEIESIIKNNIDSLGISLHNTREDNSRENYSWPLLLVDESNDYGYHSISAFVDHNQNYNGYLLDYNCGVRTYDTPDYNHQGTDFAIWPFGWNKVEDESVWVVSAISGILIAKQDGNYDLNCDWDSNNQWNGVFILNDDGLVSLYGHMKNGSITSKNIGDSIEVGDYLGVVASSGVSNGPHLHFENWTIDSEGYFDELIDPYQGDCNPTINNSYWTDQRPYYDSAINKLMTNSAIPEFNWDTCPEPANIYASDAFYPGSTVYITAYYRDQLAYQNSLWQYWDPDGNLTYSFTNYLDPAIYGVDFWQASYWTAGFTVDQNMQLGAWTVTITYENDIYEHNFNICSQIIGDLNNDMIIDVIDIINLVNCILYEDGCNGCYNIIDDNIINIIDIVELVNIILENN